MFTLSSSHPVAKFLRGQKLGDQSPLATDMLALEQAIDHAGKTAILEAVPAEMMQMFSDEQWPRLIFELQPSAVLFESRVDVAEIRQQIMQSLNPDLGKKDAAYQWLVFSDQDGTLVRQVNADEYAVLIMMANGADFDAMSACLWPQLERHEQHHNMTEMLMGWLEEKLIVDAGVPIPEDAEYEQLPEGFEE